MNFTFLVFLFLTVNVTDESDVIGSHEPVKATVGQDVILPCHLEPPSDLSTLTVEWRQDEKHVHRYRSGADYLADQDENFKDRTSLFHEEMTRGNISLKLTKVTELDAGNYTCHVPKLPSQVRRGKVTLTVDESDVIGSHEPVKATVGQDVILPCHLEPPSDLSTLTVEWKQDEKHVHRYRSGADYLVDQDENFKDRTSLFHEEMTRGNISLKLNKVTERDAGNYTCHVPKLPSQVRRGNVTLTVEQLELICSKKPIVALAGDDVILPCHLEPPIDADLETVVWTRPDLEPKYIHYHQDGRLNSEIQNPSYHLRTRLFVDELKNGNVSMKILKVKLSDAGEYKCSLPSMQKEASIQLTVGESDVIGSHEPVKATVGQDVILPCHLEPPSDVSTLTVEWRQDEKQVHRYRSGKDYLALQDENFKDRTSLFHEEMIRGNISLKLTNVTERDAGNYTCHVPKLPSQVKRGNVTLTVESMDDPDKRRQTNKTEILTPADGRGLSSAAVVGIVIGILFIVGIGLLVWKKCRNAEQNAGDGGGRQEDDIQVNIPLNDLGDNADK